MIYLGVNVACDSLLSSVSFPLLFAFRSEWIEGVLNLDMSALLERVLYLDVSLDPLSLVVFLG